jgi:hypothetical protein
LYASPVKVVIKRILVAVLRQVNARCKWRILGSHVAAYQ